MRSSPVPPDPTALFALPLIISSDIGPTICSTRLRRTSTLLEILSHLQVASLEGKKWVQKLSDFNSGHEDWWGSSFGQLRLSWRNFQLQHVWPVKEESRVTSFLLLQSILLLFSLTESIVLYKQRKTPVRKSSYSPLLRCVGRLQSTQGIALHHVQVHLGSDCDDTHQHDYGTTRPGQCGLDPLFGNPSGEMSSKRRTLSQVFT